jgi:hypothetical protein
MTLGAALRTVPRARVSTIIVAILGAVVFALAALSQRGPAHMIEHAVRDREGLHYALHLGAGRVLDLCPCTVSIAERQYDKGAYHASTERRAALVDNERPQRFADRVEALVDVAVDATRWGIRRLDGG